VAVKTLHPVRVYVFHVVLEIGDMLASILLWLAETFLGTLWKKYFPPKTAESLERKEAENVQKPATGSDDSIIGRL
jgi:hypothetical protein